MNEDKLIAMVINLDTRMTELEYNLTEHYVTKYENGIVHVNFDAIFKEIKVSQEERAANVFLMRSVLEDFRKLRGDMDEGLNDFERRLVSLEQKMAEQKLG